jgi:propionyl-CoA synthetase
MNDAAPASGYAEAYAAWRADPDRWWSAVAEGITWDRKWDRVFDPSLGPYGRWFPSATLNTCFNCLDRHVLAGRGEQAALIWDSPMTGRSNDSPIASCRRAPPSWPARLPHSA